MINIEDLKEEIKTNRFDEGVFTSENEKGETVVVEKRFGYLKTSTYQSNNWIRINIYHYDHNTNTWTEEELYDR